jgi:hypothetical protein
MLRCSNRMLYCNKVVIDFTSNAPKGAVRRTASPRSLENRRYHGQAGS